MNDAVYQHFHAWKGVADCINPLLGLWLLYAAFRPRGVPIRDFWWRVVASLVVVYIVGHSNRWFHLWPAHRLFPSGHMGFATCAAIALAAWNRKTWRVTIPLLIFYAWLMVALRFHDWLDIAGALVLASFVSYLLWAKTLSTQSSNVELTN